MRNFTYVNCDEAGLFTKVVAEKYQPKKGHLQLITQKVLGAYEEYLNDFASMEGKANSAFHGQDNECAALISCYESMTESFRSMRGQIFTCQPEELLGLCPYCLHGEPQTLDHYIEKTNFPEFSILCRNLIPCCWNCNHKKIDKWRKGDERLFIHFYNDAFLHHRFLHARLIYGRESVIPKIDFFLTKPDDMPDEEFRIVSSHFDVLELLSRYNKIAASHISAEVIACIKSNADGLSWDQIQQSLLHRANGQENIGGPNYWWAVIYKTLANAVPFNPALV